MHSESQTKEAAEGSKSNYIEAVDINTEQIKHLERTLILEYLPQQMIYLITNDESGHKNWLDRRQCNNIYAKITHLLYAREVGKLGSKLPQLQLTIFTIICHIVGPRSKKFQTPCDERTHHSIYHNFMI